MRRPAQRPQVLQHLTDARNRYRPLGRFLDPDTRLFRRFALSKFSLLFLFFHHFILLAHYFLYFACALIFDLKRPLFDMRCLRRITHLLCHYHVESHALASDRLDSNPHLLLCSPLHHVLSHLSSLSSYLHMQSLKKISLHSWRERFPRSRAQIAQAAALASPASFPNTISPCFSLCTSLITPQRLPTHTPTLAT